MKKHKNNFKSFAIGFDCEVNGMSTDINDKMITSFIAFKQPILLKTDAVFCNGRKKKRKK